MAEGPLAQSPVSTTPPQVADTYPYGDSPRWFYVTEINGGHYAGKSGYVYSAFIPVNGQVSTPKCDNTIKDKYPAIEPVSPTDPATVEPGGSTSAPLAPQREIPAPAPARAPASEPPARPTYAETTGGVVHTWTDYASGGGTEGPQIASNATVQITCKVNGLSVTNGNTSWYRIVSRPWNGNYYASADAFLQQWRNVGEPTPG